MQLQGKENACGHEADTFRRHVTRGLMRKQKYDTDRETRIKEKYNSNTVKSMGNEQKDDTRGSLFAPTRANKDY